MKKETMDITRQVLNSKKQYVTLSPLDIAYVIAMIKEITGRRLTKREVECLSFWLKGFSIKDTAKMLGGLSSRTIQTFRENIKRKMNVENYQQLLSMLRESGGISILLKDQWIASFQD